MLHGTENCLSVQNENEALRAEVAHLKMLADALYQATCNANAMADELCRIVGLALKKGKK